MTDRHDRTRRTGRWIAWTTLATLTVAPAPLQAQQTEAADSLYQRYSPIDLTGTWVSIVTEDWQVRMIVPPRGDFESLPLTQAAQDAANAVDMAQVDAAGRACEAYGAPMIMREPGRVRIAWHDATTLRIETDAGSQTRLLHFDTAGMQSGAPSLQGFSVAAWEYAGSFNPRRAAEAAAGTNLNPEAQVGRPEFGRGANRTEPDGGKLRVETTNLTAGFLRKNGVPYSVDTTVTEYYNLLREPDGTEWFVVTTRIHDPENLVVDYIHSTNFRREPDNSSWNPTPCTLQ
jgi:hypothetical protein